MTTASRRTAWAIEMTDERWVVFGVTLTLTATDEGGRRKPIGVAGEPYKRGSYRPNWGLLGMTGNDQVGAVVLALGQYPLEPGDTTRAVIVPFAPGSLPLWQEVKPGDHLRTLEGARIVGTAVVEWLVPTGERLNKEDEERLSVWAEGGETPC